MKKKPILKKNIGVCHERTKYDKGWGINFEKVFQEKWDAINRDSLGSSTPDGIAQALFYTSKESADKFDGPGRDDIGMFRYSGPEVCVYRLTGREQRIIATMMQWLGTNVGQSFLSECFKECGYQLQRIKGFKEPERPRPPPPPPSPWPSHLNEIETKFILLAFLAHLYEKD